MRTRGKRKRSHARMRAEQRYFIHITDSGFREIERIIREGKAENYEKVTNSRTLVHVNYGANKFRLIYSRKHKKIVTFLPN